METQNRPPISGAIAAAAMLTILLVVLGLGAAWWNGATWVVPALEWMAIVTLAVIPASLVAGLIAAAWHFARKGQHHDQERLTVSRTHPRRWELEEQIIARRLDAACINAVQPGSVVPHSLSLSLSNRVQVQGGDPAAILPQLPQLPPIRSVRDLLQLGGSPAFGRDHQTGAPVMVEGVRSFMVVGESGSGKTNTAAVIAAQAHMRGDEVIILDPHAGAGEESLTAKVEALVGPLPKLQLAGPDPAAMVKTFRRVKAEFDRRKRAPFTGRCPERNVLLLVDEHSAMLGEEGYEDVIDGLAKIGREGRKYNVAGGILLQGGMAADTGSSRLRNAFRRVVALHKIAPQEAHAVLGIPTQRLPDQLEALPVGRAWVVSDRGQSLVQVPDLVDLVPVGDSFGVSDSVSGFSETPINTSFRSGNTKINTSETPTGSQHPEGSETPNKHQINTKSGFVNTSETPTETPITPEQVDQIISMAMLGAKDRDIAREVFGVWSGPRYGEAIQAVTVVRTAHMQELAALAALNVARQGGGGHQAAVRVADNRLKGLQ